MTSPALHCACTDCAIEIRTLRDTTRSLEYRLNAMEQTYRREIDHLTARVTALVGDLDDLYKLRRLDGQAAPAH